MKPLTLRQEALRAAAEQISTFRTASIHLGLAHDRDLVDALDDAERGAWAEVDAEDAAESAEEWS